MLFGSTKFNMVQGRLILYPSVLLVQQQDLFPNFEKGKIGREIYLSPVTINYVLVSGFILTAAKAEMII